MQAFSIISCLIFLILNFLMLWDVKKVLNSIPTHICNGEDIKESLTDLLQDIVSLDNKIQSLSSLASQSPQSPMKPNNWDSIREAFKGPVRTEGNERT